MNEYICDYCASVFAGIRCAACGAPRREIRTTRVNVRDCGSRWQRGGLGSFAGNRDMEPIPYNCDLASPAMLAAAAAIVFD